MKRSVAEVVCEYGPFPGLEQVHGVTFDGHHVWFASGDKLNAFDPASGKLLRSIDVPAHAGTAFDGQYLFQIAEDRIQKIDPKTGHVLAAIPAQAQAGTRGWPGLKEHCGWDSIAGGRSIRSIRKRERFFVPSSPTASSQGSPGLMTNSGMLAGKVTKAICDASILGLGRSWRRSTCPLEWAYRVWSRMVAISSSAAAEAVGR